MADANRLTTLLTRRKNYETAIDELVTGAASVTISGGVSYTRTNLDQIRAALGDVNAEIAALVTARQGGMVRTVPRYT